MLMEIDMVQRMFVPDLNCFTTESAMSMVAGTARSMGIVVKGGTNPFENN